MLKLIHVGDSFDKIVPCLKSADENGPVYLKKRDSLQKIGPKGKKFVVNSPAEFEDE